MADFLKQHLEEKAKSHSALAMLKNQWGFDEQLIPKALQNVAAFFPHFSRHDESHSKQILINVERLLGDNIKLLTATDTWLLLEAAYWHDIGMVVNTNDVEEAFADESFVQYLSSIKSNPHHELYKFARNFDPKNSYFFNGVDSPIEAVDKYRQLVAEWFRRKHPARAEVAVQTPWTTAGISSPRTELIPMRLFRILGRICHMHGRPFDELFSNDGLAYKEAGLAREDCHPRFVACMLRMGDLLDLDDNRFCPVMQMMAGDKRSSLSKAHEDKHSGIRHLWINQERIEVTAECATIDGYLETFKWFDWLKSEIQNQTAKWQEIAPNRDLGLLPTLGDLTVKLRGEMHLLKEGERPQFTLDKGRAFDLLQGNNLYTYQFSCIRELLQNAVDATLLRLWLVGDKDRNSEEWRTPYSEKSSQLLHSTFVDFDLQECAEDTDISGEKSKWIMTVTDHGTGISREDLTYMLNIGGAQKNVKRQIYIEKMPEWMKPSGAFGIGFQSIFLLASEVSIQTKSIFSNEALILQMHSPTADKEGLVLVKSIANDISADFGTKIIIQISLDKFPTKFSIPINSQNSIVSKFFHSMDPVLDASFPYTAALLADQVGTFAANSPIEIKASITTKDKKFSISPELSEKIDWKFVAISHEEDVAISYRPTSFHNFHKAIEYYYRGQRFEHNGISLPFVVVKFNLMSGKAGSWLTANRDGLRPGAEARLNQMLLSALRLQVELDLKDKGNWSASKGFDFPTFSIFLELMRMSVGGEWTELAAQLSGCWLDLGYPTNGRSLRDLFGMPSFIVAQASAYGNHIVDGCDIALNHTSLYSIMNVLIDEWQRRARGEITILHPSETKTSEPIIAANETHISQQLLEEAKFSLRFRLHKEERKPYSKLALASRLVGVTRTHHRNERFLLECPSKEYEILCLKQGQWGNSSLLFDVNRIDPKYLLLPFLYRIAAGPVYRIIECSDLQLDNLCRWVQPNLINSATLPEIKDAYSALIREIDSEIMEPSIYGEAWKRMRALSKQRDP